MATSHFAQRLFRLWLCAAAALLFQSSLWAQDIAKPLLFSGNTTVVAPPTPDTEYAFGPRDFGALFRCSDCDVKGIIATANGGSAPSFKVLSITANYQDTLHKLAGLTTKWDIWPDGCGNPGANNPAYFAADASPASDKSNVVATIDTVNKDVIDIYHVKITVTKQTVTKVQTFHIATGVGPIAALDLNGDGFADLVVGASGTGFPKSVNGGYAVLINKGDGTFEAPSFVPLSKMGIVGLAMADVNHDGKPDLIALEESLRGGHFQVGIFLGDGQGGFTAKKSYPLTYGNLISNILVTDLNNDGNPDVILSDGELLLGNGDGTFKAGSPLPLPPMVTSFVAADFNHDKKIDLAVVSFSDMVEVFLGNGDGTLQPPTVYSGVYQGEVITTADLDGDGNLDLILGAQSGAGFSPEPNDMGGTGGLGVLMGAGDGTFKGALAYPTGATLPDFAYAIADINGDGKPDILTASSLLVGDGTGHFTVNLGNQFPGLEPANVGSVLRIADLNHDNKPDAVVTTTSNGNPSSAYVFLGQGKGKFGTGTALSVPNVIDVNIADFNGDGIPDLAVLSYTMGSGISLDVLLGKGNGSFGAPRAIPLPSGAAQSTGGRIFAADFNNDKKTDLAVLDAGNFQSSINGGVYVLLGNGKGGLKLSTTLTDVKNPYDAAIADFNKDRNLDLVVSGADYNISFSTPPMIFLGSGQGTFGTGTPLPTVSQIPIHMVATDVDGDGKTDLVIGNCCGLAVTSVVFGKGDGTFEPEQIMQVAGSPSQIAVADLNGDHRPDIVISNGNRALGTLVILINEYGVVDDSDLP